MTKSYLKLVDVDTPGPRYDATPLFSDPGAFAALLDDCLDLIDFDSMEYVVGIDALGFILGTAVAVMAKKPFIPIRKGGKLPVPTYSANFIDYSGTSKSLEIRKDLIPAGATVLIVDEWIETGTQVSAAIQLIEKLGALVAGVLTINIDENEKTHPLRNTYKIYSLGTFD
jgi:adenine phosphoribosyltransferase